MIVKAKIILIEFIASQKLIKSIVEDSIMVLIHSLKQSIAMRFTYVVFPNDRSIIRVARMHLKENFTV